jgi:hypothetical protein
VVLVVVVIAKLPQLVGRETLHQHLQVKVTMEVLAVLLPTLRLEAVAVLAQSVATELQQ